MKLESLPIVLLILTSFYTSCGRNSKVGLSPRTLFSPIIGIKFSEVRRTFDTNSSFNAQGLQLEPEWKLFFTSDSSVRVYNPEDDRYPEYPIVFTHSSIVNFAREWLRVKVITKDSLVLQRLELSDKVVSKDRSNIYMTFYSDDYIKNKLNSNVNSLRSPTRKDTLFIKSRISKISHHPDSFLAARDPVILRSKSEILKVEKVEPKIDLINIDNVYAEYSYLYPEYRIIINKAYNNFAYNISVIVDEKGKMHFKEILQLMSSEFVESKKRVANGIVNVYLQNLLEITPGQTLGIPHRSKIYIYVVGRQEESKKYNEVAKVTK